MSKKTTYFLYYFEQNKVKDKNLSWLSLSYKSVCKRQSKRDITHLWCHALYFINL